MTAVSTRQYRTVVTTAPTLEPVTLAEAKLHVRVDHDDEDEWIINAISTAREWAENETRRAFINRTLRLSLDEFPSEVRLPWGKTQSVTSITYVDADGAAQTFNAASYTVDTDSEPARIWLAYNLTWPDIRSVPNAVKITYVAGYGATVASVPSCVRQAILIMVANCYEFREPNITGTIIQDVPLSVLELLNPVRVMEFH